MIGVMFGEMILEHRDDERDVGDDTRDATWDIEEDVCRRPSVGRRILLHYTNTHIVFGYLLILYKWSRARLRIQMGSTVCLDTDHQYLATAEAVATAAASGSAAPMNDRPTGRAFSLVTDHLSQPRRQPGPDQCLCLRSPPANAMLYMLGYPTDWWNPMKHGK